MDTNQIYLIAKAQVKEELIKEALEMGLDGTSLDDAFMDSDPGIQADVAEKMLSIAA